MNIFLKGLMIGAVGLLIASCSSNEQPIGDRHENKAEENEENSAETISLNKGTNTSFLTNVREIGLFRSSGRVTCMVIDKADSNHLIAGAASGGLWASRNRGKSWSVIDDQLPTLNIRSITQNPFQTNVYYASAWTAIQTGSSPNTYRPDIYKSIDGGQTFQLIPVTAGGFSQVLKVVCSPISASTVYAICDQFNSSAGVYRSTDNGLTFTHVLPLTTQLHDLEVLPDGSVFVCSEAQIYRSPTGNTGSFSSVFNGATGTNTFSSIDIAFCTNKPNNLYGVSTGGNSGVGVFKSVNAGQTWAYVQSLATGSFTRTVGIKPNDSSFFFAGSVGLYISRDAGSTFPFYGVGGVDWWSVNFDPHNSDKVFMTFDAGIVEVGLNPFNPNNNTAYVRKDSLRNCAQIYAGDHFPTGDRVIMGMQDLGTHIAYSGGERSIGSGDGGACFYHHQDTTIAYGTYQNGQIFKKSNLHIPFPQPGFLNPVSIMNQLDANNDGTIDEGAFFIHYFWMNHADGEQLYFPTRKRLWRSVNGGANWTPISNFYNVPTGSVEVFINGGRQNNPIVYWSVTDTLFVMPNAKTATPGNEIKVKLPSGYIRSVRPDPVNDSFVYITGYTATTGGRIYKSSNLFKPNVQWTNLTGDLPDRIAARTFEVNPLDHMQMILGTNSGLYVSNNGGQHWDRDIQFPNVSILKTGMRTSDNRLFIYTYGRGAWAASFPPPNPNAVTHTASKNPLTVWPNPTTGILHLAIPSGYKNPSVNILSMDGRVQRSIAQLTYSPYSINISDLPAGVYLLEFMEGSQQIMRARIVKN